MNLGSGPDRDDSGLPPVDIEIPDDASELDRDVQAYHRELRAQRRRMRLGRLHGPLTRDGLVLPLLAGFLAMVLISGVLLTVFTAGQNGTPRQPSSAHRTNTAIGPVPGIGSNTAAGQQTGKPASLLPNAAVSVTGQRVPLRSLAPALLALVPAGCRCGSAVRQLRLRAAAADVRLYLIGVGRDARQVRRLSEARPAASGQSRCRPSSGACRGLPPARADRRLRPCRRLHRAGGAPPSIAIPGGPPDPVPGPGHPVLKANGSAPSGLASCRAVPAGPAAARNAMAATLCDVAVPHFTLTRRPRRDPQQPSS